MIENIPSPGNANTKPINANQLQSIGINDPSVIPTIERPVTRSIDVPVVQGLSLPIFEMPKPKVPYPVIDVPTQEEFDAAVRAEQQKEEDKPEKNRELPNAKPIDLPPAIRQITNPPATVAEIPANKPQPTFTVLGADINLPDPSLVATAGAVAVVTTASTMVATTALNALKNAAEPMIREATKNKFKIKIKQVKPVLHYVMAEEGHVDIFEYSSEGTRLVTQTDNVEQYIRDQIDTNALYEIDNKVIIDDIIKNRFTKEGQERFKSLYAPPRKIAKKLSARLSI